MPLSKQAWLALSFHFLLAPPHDLFADGSLFSPLFRDSSNLSSPSPGGGLGSWLTALRLITPSPFFAVFDFGLQLASTSASTSSFFDCGVMSCRRGAVGIWGLYQERELADWWSLWGEGSGESLLNWSWRGVSEWDGGRESIALDCKTASKSFVNEEEDWPQKKAWVV